MNAHDFYNLLEGRTHAPTPPSSAIWELPEDFAARYADAISRLHKHVAATQSLLSELSELEREHFQYTAGGDRA